MMGGKVHGKCLGFDWRLWSCDIFRLHRLTRRREHVAEIRLQLVGYRNAAVGKWRQRHRRLVFLIVMDAAVTVVVAVVHGWSRGAGHAQPRKR